MRFFLSFVCYFRKITSWFAFLLLFFHYFIGNLENKLKWNNKKNTTNWYRNGEMSKTAELMPHNRQHFHLSQIQNSKRWNVLIPILRYSTKTKYWHSIWSNKQRKLPRFRFYTSTHSMCICFMWCFKSQKHAQLQSIIWKKKSHFSILYRRWRTQRNRFD